MIRLAVEQRERSIRLLRHHDAGQLVWQCDRAESQAPPCPPRDCVIRAEGPANHQRETLRRLLEETSEELRIAGGVDRITRAIEQDEWPVAERACEPLPLPLEDFAWCSTVERFILDLDHLETRLFRYSSLVLGCRFGERAARTTDDEQTERGSVPVVAVARLGQLADPFARGPLLVIVLHGVQELAHESRGQIHPTDDDARDLLVLNLMIDSGERDRELVVGVRDVREVGVVARHLFRREVDVQMALAVVFGFHGVSIRPSSQGQRR